MEEMLEGVLWPPYVYIHAHTHLREVKILKRITDSNNQEQQWLFPCFSKQTK